MKRSHHNLSLRRFNQIYSDHADLIFNFILKIVKDRSVAEELTADAFIKFWSKRDEIAPINYRNLLLTISKNLSFNHLKKIGRESQLREQFIQSYYFSDSEDWPEVVEKEKNLQLLEKYIDAMAEKRKRVFQLRYYQKLSLKEIATQLNISINTVQNHLTKGKNELKRHFGDHNVKNIYIALLVYLFIVDDLVDKTLF